MKLAGEFNPVGFNEGLAKRQFMRSIEKVLPHVLQELKNIAPGDNDQLQVWAKKYNLTDHWLISIAKKNQKHWHDYPGLANKSLEWIAYPGASYWQPLRDEVKVFRFNHAGWNPVEETRANFKRRIKVEFNNLLDNYMSRLEEACKNYNLNNTNNIMDHHFIWLVRYQVNNESMNSIAKENYMDRKNVGKQIREIAKLCSITLRPMKAGRPKNI